MLACDPTMSPTPRTALLLSTLALVLGACSAVSTGLSGRPTAVGVSKATDRSLDLVDPCTLVSPAETARFQAGPAQPHGERTCVWNVPGGGFFGLTLRGEYGLDDIVNTSGELSDEAVGGRKAKRLVEETGPGGCLLAIEVGRRSRVDVQGIARGDTAKACDMVTTVAALIEPRLPQGR